MIVRSLTSWDSFGAVLKELEDDLVDPSGRSGDIRGLRWGEDIVKMPSNDRPVMLCFSELL